jgi:hypothetical protein
MRPALPMVLRFAFPTLVASFIAAAAHADVLVNNRAGDPAGAVQTDPRVAQVFNDGSVGNAGEYVVVEWLSFVNPSTQSRTRFAVAAVPSDPGPYTFNFTNDGVPTPPTGYVWSLDPVIHGVPNDLSGVFYVAGRVRTPGTPPTIGLGFARGFVESPSSVAFDHVSVVASFGTGDPVVSYFGATDMKVHPVDASIYMLYAPYAMSSDQRNAYFVRSTDGGATWTPPTRVSSDSTYYPGAPSILCGQVAGDVTFFWQQNDADPAYVDLFSRHSSNNGVTLGPPVQVMQFPNNPQNSPNRTLPFREYVEMDRFNATYAGTAVCAMAVGLDLTHDTFPTVASAASISEVEPNGAATSATLVPAIGDVVRGNISAVSDTDFYAFDLAAGQQVNTLADSIPDFSVSQALILSWVGTDGKSILTRTSQTGPGNLYFGFTAPSAARYYLRVSAFSAPGAYRLRTVVSAPHAPGADDQHDIALSRLAPGGSWTGGQLMSPLNPIGYDENAIAMTSCVDGGLFATYDDFSVLPGRAVSRRSLRRSSDGGATWSTPATMSSANTDWAAVTGNDLGSADMVTDGVRMYSVWTDGRNGDPDVYFQFVYRRLFVLDGSPVETSAPPGAVVHFQSHVQNADSLENFDVRMDPENDAGWTLAPTDATLAPAQTALLDCAFQVPPTAVPGDVNMTFYYRPSDNPAAAFGVRSMLVHVLAPAGVQTNNAPTLALAAPAPNPMRSSGELRFSLAHATQADIELYALDGRRVRTLVDGARRAGWQSVMWDGTDARGAPVAPGAYYIRLRTEGHSLIQRFVFLR